MRQRDMRASNPPLGESAPNQVVAGNALCHHWFGVIANTNAGQP